MELWIATSNSGKVNEFRSLLYEKKLDLKTPRDLAHYSSPAETGTTFVENARIKAQSLQAMVKNQWIVAEDSGLEVFGLNNMPGIHSARYAGDNARDQENVSKVIKMVNLRTPMERQAQFNCAIVAISPEGKEHVFEGTVKGEISKKVSGTAGFGYDVCFIPEGETKTFAELGTPFKNKVSHRSQAIKQLSQLF